MVLIVLHRHYLAFPNVRFSPVAQELGRSGELRLTKSGKILFRVYRPRRYEEWSCYLYISGKMISVDNTIIEGCEAQINTLNGYQYWFRFPTDTDASIFSCLLDQVEDLGSGQSQAQIREERRRLNFRQADLIWLERIVSDEDDRCTDDHWIEPWTDRDVIPDEDWADCRCREVGQIRYSCRYINEFCQTMRPITTLS